MHLYTPKITLYLITPLFLLMASLIVLSPQANASVVVSGDREFTDDVNNCLTTYRNAPGIVGDVIRELEDSDNEHRIINNTDWTNTINSVDEAYNGTGVGTVTRVDKAELEKYKKSFPELINKDFCTALLHELWHAVDADRGEWSSDKLGNVNRNEIEATMFQNFVHAIRGVDPRTAYGGVDISRFILIGDDAPKEVVKEPEPKPKTEISVNTSFKHVAPGSYSEIYATVKASPGVTIQIKLSGPGVDSPPSQTINTDNSGVAKFTWRIVAYGNYTLSGTAGGESFSSGVNVQ